MIPMWSALPPMLRLKPTLPSAHLDDIEAMAAMMLRSAIPVEDVLAKCEAEG